MIVVGLGAKCNKSVIILNYQLSFINYQYIMKKILPDLIAILAFIILSFAYFFPADIEGRILFQHDSVAGVGAGHAVFVRFSGCNLRCPFCDTQHEEGTLMSDEDIVMEVAKYSTQIVILTGGEPGLWIDEKLVDVLHHEGKYVCIETNGTCLLPENIDWVTCSPKEGAKINLDRIDEVKVVYVGQDVSAYLDLSASHYFLQPCSCANTEEVIAYILQHPEWRLSLQTHKLLQIP